MGPWVWRPGAPGTADVAVIDVTHRYAANTVGTVSIQVPGFGPLVGLESRDQVVVGGKTDRPPMHRRACTFNNRENGVDQPGGGM